MRNVFQQSWAKQVRSIMRRVFTPRNVIVSGASILLQYALLLYVVQQFWTFVALVTPYSSRPDHMTVEISVALSAGLLALIATVVAGEIPTIVSGVVDGAIARLHPGKERS